MAVTFFAVDLARLGAVASGFYRNALGHLMRDSPHGPRLLRGLTWRGFLVFAVLPGLEADSLQKKKKKKRGRGSVAYAGRST